MKRAERMISDGADIIDLGERVPGLELKKFHWKKSETSGRRFDRDPELKIPVSIDT